MVEEKNERAQTSQLLLIFLRISLRWSKGSLAICSKKLLITLSVIKTYRKISLIQAQIHSLNKINEKWAKLAMPNHNTAYKCSQPSKEIST